jgi:hypothetical protein
MKFGYARLAAFTLLLLCVIGTLGQDYFDRYNQIEIRYTFYNLEWIDLHLSIVLLWFDSANALLWIDLLWFDSASALLWIDLLWFDSEKEVRWTGKDNLSVIYYPLTTEAPW